MRLGRFHARSLPFLATAVVLAVLPSRGRAQSALEAWERVEEVRQTQSPDRAMALSAEAISRYPDFLPLTRQRTLLHLSRGGHAAVLAWIESLRKAGHATRANAAEILLVLDQGDIPRAREILTSLPQATSGSAEEAFGWVNEADVELNSGDPGRYGIAERLLDRAGGHPALRPPDRYAAQYMDLMVQRGRAVLAIQRGQAEEGLAQLDALATKASARFRQVELRARFVAGRIGANLARWTQAEVRFAQSLEVARALNDTRTIAAASGWLGFVFERQNRFTDAFEHQATAVRLYPALGEPVPWAYSLLGLGWSGIKIGRGEAEEALEKAVELGRRQGFGWAEFYGLNNLGVLHMGVGRFDLSRSFLEQGLDLAESLENEMFQTMALNNLAILHTDEERPDRAIVIYQQLLEIHRANANVREVLTILNNLGLANEAMNQPLQAAEFYRQCLRTAEENDEEGLYARNNLGRILGQYGEFEEAREHLQIVLREAAPRGDVQLLSSAHADLGRTLSFELRPEEARHHLALADSLRASSGQFRKRIPDLLRLAMVHLQLGQTAKAQERVDAAEAIAKDFIPTMLPTCAGVRASILADVEPLQARAEARRALDLARQTRAVDGGQKSLWQAAALAAVMAHLKSQEQEPVEARPPLVAEAFAMAQEAKARSLLEYVTASQRAIEPDVPDSLAQGERRARAAVDELRSAIENAAVEVDLDSLRLALAEARIEHERLRTAIFNTDRRYQRVATPPRIDVSQARELTDDTTLVLDFVVSRACESAFPCPVQLFVLDRKRLEVHEIADARELQRLVTLLVDSLSLPPGDDDETISILLGELGRILLEPVADDLGRYEKIVVVPDGFLHRVPFAALLLPSSSDYLVEHARLTTVPSLAVLRELRAEKNVEPTTEAIWDLAIWPGPAEDPDRDFVPGPDGLSALPHAADELRALKRRFPNSTVFATDLQEDLDLDVQLAGTGLFGQSRIFHFIAHGFFDDVQPWRSGLYLDLPRPDGPAHKLEIADVYTMDFRSELITLSACDMGRGDRNDGVGFQGFAQALFGSGATAVLATLWSIDDASTPLFMVDFYGHLSEGSAKAEALRRAQLGFLQNEDLRHPFYWAPYVLLGDGAGTVALARASMGRRGPWAWLALGGVLLAAAVWTRRRRNVGA